MLTKITTLCVGQSYVSTHVLGVKIVCHQTLKQESLRQSIYSFYFSKKKKCWGGYVFSVCASFLKAADQQSCM